MDDTTTTTNTGTGLAVSEGDLDYPVAIRGVLLRSVLLLALDRARAGSLTVAELCEAVRSEGSTVVGRASKVVSDALRWEVGRGRARWRGRGRYCIGELPRTTRWRCQQRVRAARRGDAPRHHLHDGTRTAQRVHGRSFTSPLAAEVADAPQTNSANEWMLEASLARPQSARVGVVAGRRNAMRCPPPPVRPSTAHEAEGVDQVRRAARAAEP